MKHLIKILLFSSLGLTFAFMGISADAQNNTLATIEGAWVFEQAEYMEKPPSTQSYQVKHTINNKENLYAYSNCFQELVMSVDFYGGVAKTETLFTPYIGKYFLLSLPSSDNKQMMIMQVGSFEDIGKDSHIPGMKFNAPGFRYLVETIDENTIAITLEKTCFEEDVFKESAVRVYYKKR